MTTRVTSGLAHTPVASSSSRSTSEVSPMLRTSDPIATGTPAEIPGFPRIRETYRALIVRGFRSAEAANLVAYLNGLPVGDVSWTLDEVNRLLFLRHRYQCPAVANRNLGPYSAAAAAKEN